MSLSVKSVKGTTVIKWIGEMAKGEMTAEWKISPSMTQEEVLDVLMRATNFLAAQMDSISQEMESLPLPFPGAPDTRSVTTDTPTTAPPTSSAPATGIARVPMMPPVSLSDKPAGGAPTNQDFWSSMPTTVGQEMTSSPMGWEMIPPGED